MQTIRKKLVAGLAAVFLICGHAWAAVTIELADGRARQALELKQYSEVVRVYSDVQQNNLKDQSHYRLAIAQQRLGNNADAEKSLSSALKINPKGTFASSPERIIQLQKAISDGLMASAKPVGPADAPLAPVPAPAAIVEPVTSVAPAVPASSAQAALTEAKPDSTSQPATKRPNDEGLNAVQSTVDNMAINGLNLYLMVVNFGGLVVVISLLAKITWKQKNTGITEENAKISRLSLHEKMDALVINHAKPVSDVGNLVALREEVIKVQRLIETAGTTDSTLYKSICKLEPLVTMEIGRNHFRSTRDLTALVQPDQESLASVAKLEKAPLLIDGADAKDVMASVFGGHARVQAALKTEPTESR